jgi:hypothetical protein
MPSQLGAGVAFDREGSDSVGREPLLLVLLAGAGGACACGATRAGDEERLAGACCAGGADACIRAATGDIADRLAWPAAGLALTELDRPAAI